MQACSYFVLRSFALLEGQHLGLRFARLIGQVTKRTECLVEWLDMIDSKEGWAIPNTDRIKVLPRPTLVFLGK